DGEFPVAVHGLGHIGLPLAAVYAEVTGAVTGVDVDPEVVAAVERGEAHVDEPGLQALLERVTGTGALRATTDPTAVGDVSVVAFTLFALLVIGFSLGVVLVRDAFHAALSGGSIVSSDGAYDDLGGVERVRLEPDESE
ncbi:nucleotide sugar dehydrogenase, partial [Halobacteriales archaeon QH_3_68_24]